jgi:uncharacterized membrane protein
MNFKNLIIFLQYLYFSIAKNSLYCLVLIFFTIGIVFSLLIPPFQVPDENAHWYAAYQRSEQLFNPTFDPQKDCLFANSLPSHFETARISFAGDQKTDGSFYRSLPKMKKHCYEFKLGYGNVLTYPGVIFARVFNIKENLRSERNFQTFILSRFFQGIIVVLALLRLCFLFSKSNQIQPGLSTFFAFFLSPLMIQQSFAVSADTIFISLSAYLVILVLYFKKLNYFDWLAIFLLSVSCALTKPPQIVLLLTALFFGYLLSKNSKNTDKSKLKINYYTALFVGIATILASAWMTYKNIFPDSMNPNSLSFQGEGRNISASLQLKFFFEDINRGVSNICNSLNQYFDFEILMSPLGWLDTPIRSWSKSYWYWFLETFFIFDIIGLLLVVTKKIIDKDSLSKKFISSFFSFLSLSLTTYLGAFLIVLTLYLTWTTVGAEGVSGLQGRYFLPIFALIPVFIGGLLISPFSEDSYQINNLEKISLSEKNAHTLSNLVAITSVIIIGLSFLSIIYTDLIRRWW